MNRAGEWCASRGNIAYLETSVKDDYNVDAAFHHVAQLVLHSDLHKSVFSVTGLHLSCCSLISSLLLLVVICYFVDSLELV
ncbi:hypothetical protein GW17_00024755 [Ensete ventricosum]|nr:hypothetical protein GW17_00024755 [Ensete ventricosum]